jgi:soluble lytic murein transglycosylase-like protein
MGTPKDDLNPRSLPPTRARRRALRAVLATLAGGGLTAAALGAPLAGSASAANFSGVPTTPEVSAESAAGAQTGASTTPSAPASTTPASTTTTPAPTTTSTTTTTTPTASTPASPPAAQETVQVAHERSQKATNGAKRGQAKKQSGKNAGENNVAGSPQTVAEESELEAVLASSQASVQALAFYRVPLFMLPIYKAAAVQYGVPWQVLAAVNEIETDYGSDLSVSSAGAVGWMQFMPSTWLQYGVDALDAGYADPYNPVDAVFAAARYLRAAGAATNLRDAIMAYNHSEEYVESVLLRAKLISTYPKAVIATLTGLVDGRVPVSGTTLEWSALPSEATPTSVSTSASGSSSTNANAPTATTASVGGEKPGSTAAPSPTAAASGVNQAAPSSELADLMTSPKADVVAVQPGRIVKMGDSRKIGKYIVLRDVYGDVFTYADLGSIAPTYSVQKPTGSTGSSAAVKAASSKAPAPSGPATAGSQAPVTLQVKAPAPQDHGSTGGRVALPINEAAPAGMQRKRLFAHPGNPDARAAQALTAERRARAQKAGEKLPLRVGSVVSSGTVLGTVVVPKGYVDGHLRFAVRPAGDSGYINPGPILANWAQLQKALHPEGAQASDPLLGATASDVFLMSRTQLERTVLSDPSITLPACARQEVAAGAIDSRVLAVLEFMSRSGLAPTVSALRCGQSEYSSDGQPSSQYRGDAVDISAINGIPLAGHQGAGTITDLTIRALLTLPGEFVPSEILSLMHYPSSPNTHADAAHWNHIAVVFEPSTASTALRAGSTADAAHSAAKGKAAPAPVVTTSSLTSEQWTQLLTRVAAIPTPKIVFKPSASAIPDPTKQPH